MKFKLSVKKINGSGSADKSSEILLEGSIIKNVVPILSYPGDHPEWTEDKPVGMQVLLHVYGRTSLQEDEGKTGKIYKWAGMCLSKGRKQSSSDKTLGGVYRDVEARIYLANESDEDAFRVLHLPWATVVKYEEGYDDEEGEGSFHLVLRQDCHAIKQFQSDKSRAFEVSGKMLVTEAQSSKEDKMEEKKKEEGKQKEAAEQEKAVAASAATAAATNAEAAPAATETKDQKAAQSAGAKDKEEAAKNEEAAPAAEAAENKDAAAAAVAKGAAGSQDSEGTKGAAGSQDSEGSKGAAGSQDSEGTKGAAGSQD
ncbi:MAG: hypothetical protein II687_02435, partial [Selenomonadaceae bacterium]|nr:hypothetical protein [Selenomonadaceae bacterium]